MSKDIWHKLPEQPEKDRNVIERWHHLGIHYTLFVAKNGIAEDDPFTDAWCYLEDLLALEFDLERTRKALEIAIDTIKKASDALIGCQEADNKYISYTEDALELLSDALDKIRFLQKD